MDILGSCTGDTTLWHHLRLVSLKREDDYWESNIGTLELKLQKINLFYKCLQTNC